MANISICQQSIDFRKTLISDFSCQDTSDLPTLGLELEKKIQAFDAKNGTDAFLDLFRISANIPESIKADSSEEKRYSKFTDVMLSLALKKIGLSSIVLDARSDSADVEAVGKYGINLVADAKAFRMSRTAKNQKDFKIPAMHKWKNGKPHALLVCPIYQLPPSQSQIYFQAEANNVCIFSYSHLCVLIRLAQSLGVDKAQKLLSNVFDQTFSLLPPAKSALDYWKAVNSEMINFDQLARQLWNEEKLLIEPSISVGKTEALNFLQTERTRILSLTKEEAIREILNLSKIDSKIDTVRSIAANNNFEVA